LGLHTKPIVLMNVEGYWDPLIALMDHMINSSFADASLRDLFTVQADAAGAVAYLSRENASVS
jgi:predicted Rossmann-fold nucleotide-binding protein